MADRIARAADDDDEREIEVRLGSLVEYRSPDPDADEFAKSAADVRTLDGLTPAIKRKATRELQKFHQGAGGAGSKKEEVDLVTGYNLFQVVMPPYNLDYLAQLFEKSAPHASAVKAKVNNIAGLGHEFIESPKTSEVLDNAEGDDKKLARIRKKLLTGKRELNDWLKSTNEEDTFTETLIKVWTDYETTGNGYLEIGRKTNGQIGYIGHVPATTMRVRKKRDGFVQIISNRAVFFRHFGDTKTVDPIAGDKRPNEIIHLKKYSPTNGYYGVPDIIAALPAVVGNEYSSRFNLDYFENKAVPRYVIVIKGGNLSPRSEQQILEFFQTNMKGKNHRTLYVPLPADEQDKKVSFEMKPVETGVQDSSFPNYRKGNLNEILMAHGVPITKVSAGEGIALAAARDLDKTFKEQVCRPQQEIFEDKLNKVIGEVTDVFILKLNELSLTDEATQAKIDDVYLKYQVYVPNEVRIRKGMPGRKGGDKPFELKPQDKANATANGNRQRDTTRAANATDSVGQGRSAQGDGRTTA